MDLANPTYSVLQRRGEPAALVVDDDPVAVRLITAVLSGLGVKSHSAASAAEALHLHDRHGYRLVVADWLMPGASGTDLCKAVRDLGGPYVYFALCTVKSRREDRLEAYEAGVDDFFPKPVDSLELRAKLTVADRILSVHDHLQAQAEELRLAHDKLKGMNGSLLLASRRFAELFNGLPVPCFTFSRDGLIHEWNRFAESVFGMAAHAAFQRPVWDVLGPASDEFWSPDLVNALFSGETLQDREWRFESRSGESRHFSANVLPFENQIGEVVGVICANLDVTDRRAAKLLSDQQMEEIHAIADQLKTQKQALERANDALSRQAITDGLTGLWNHRKFREELVSSVEDHMARGKPLSVVLADVDQFKAYNDTFGHMQGDTVLVRVAEIFRRKTRAGECPARYGGEEFAFIMNGANAKQATERAERLRLAIVGEEWPLRPITVSFGVAEMTADVQTPQGLLELADQALYRAKALGRNQVCTYEHASTQTKRRSEKKAA